MFVAEPSCTTGENLDFLALFGELIRDTSCRVGHYRSYRKIEVQVCAVGAFETATCARFTVFCFVVLFASIRIEYAQTTHRTDVDVATTTATDVATTTASDVATTTATDVAANAAADVETKVNGRIAKIVAENNLIEPEAL